MQLSKEEMSVIQQNVYLTMNEMFNKNWTSVLYKTLCKYKELIFDIKALSDKVSSEIIDRFNKNINIIETKYNGKTVKQIFSENWDKQSLLSKGIGRASNEEIALVKNEHFITEINDERKFIQDNFNGLAYTDFILSGESGIGHDDTYWQAFIKKPEIAKLFEKYKLAF